MVPGRGLRTSLSGREISRFTGVLGLAPDAGRFAETGQQAPQYVLEELLREAVGELAGARLVEEVAGRPVQARVVSTDPWAARMQIADRMRRGRVFLAGDAALLNPPFGGHGLNTGIGDAVDLGWKLAAVLTGWAGPRVLDSYEAERRPVQERVIREATTATMRVLSTELLAGNLEADDAAGEAARRAAARVQETERAEFHSLDLVLGLRVEDSPPCRRAPGPHRPAPGYLGGPTKALFASGFALAGGVRLRPGRPGPRRYSWPGQRSAGAGDAAWGHPEGRSSRSRRGPWWSRPRRRCGGRS
ncbi:FAD-dependent monooxygenase [Streptomyces albidoflavus]|uniref:FAD-dependent monooxygenase n=1 Tax=Streptomyces albidoflavus TaxID=1886 RepID=UPI0027E394D9|nr:FAD-dependent monooxygenase [Streptomyces albidoflavus]